MEGEFVLEQLLSRLIETAREKFKGKSEDFEKRLIKRLPKTILGANKVLRKTVLKTCITEIRKNKKREKELAGTIANRYASSLPYFEILIEFNLLITQGIYRKYYKLMTTHDDQLKLDVQIEIHARGCQIASEIRLLVKNGYADGAHARWRSLHELCIIFLFLYDSDHIVTKMYLEYEVIESWNKLKKYQDSYPKLGWRPIHEKQVKALEAQRSLLITQYGKEFSKSYGWTMSVLAPGERTIRGIEKHVGKDYLSGIYSWASENVHAGISGNRKRLGLGRNSNKFLIGPTDQGLFDPIQFTSYSLIEMSNALLFLEDSMMHTFYRELLEDLHDMLVKQMTIDEKSHRTSLRKNSKKRGSGMAKQILIL